MEPIELKLPKKEPLVIGNLRFDSSHDFRLTEQDQEIINKELKESEDNKQPSLQKLKEKLAGTKHMRYRNDDAYLLRYLRWAKYDCDRAYKAIKNLYSQRHKHPELFLLPSNLDFLMNNFPAIYLPYKDDKGRIMYLLDFGKWNLDEMPLESMFIAINALSDIVSMNPHLQVKGHLVIWDCSGVSVHHVSLVTNTMKLWTLFNILLDCYPWRVHQVVILHCTPLIRACYSVLRMFVKKKIADRVKLLGSELTELHQYVNPAVLPKKYGGMLEESECSITDIISDNLPYLKYERSFGFQTSS